jgi:PKD repeat protein
MKKLYALSLLLALFVSYQSIANEILVKGYVKFSNGTPAPNVKVKVFVEVPCVAEHILTTNGDGFYSGKIHCEGPILKVRISIECAGQIISQLKEVNPNLVVEANFTACAPPVNCVAKFTATQVPPGEHQVFPVKFNSSASEVSSGDKIIDRTWKFGDGHIMEHGTVDPTHNYVKPGIYEVCLIIKTDKGCTSTKCMRVEVKGRCHAAFRFELTNTPNTVKFNSSASEAPSIDPIIHRSWNFGDGSEILKDRIDPLHTFPKPGTYNVCLVVWTAGGCESRECKQVVIPERRPECKARFSFERIAPKKFRFNSRLSVVTPGDEIIERQWEFRDGTHTVITNDISIVHEFAKPGLYEVCLKIKTAKGCESKFCLPVRVGEGEHQGEGSVKIISLYPTPVHNELKAIIYSRLDHIPATISIVDVYGQIKWTKQVWLAQGNNPFEIPTGFLLPGPYFIRVTSSFGVQSKLIHKI